MKKYRKMLFTFLILFTKHDAVNVNDPSSKQDMYHIRPLQWALPTLSLSGSVVEHQSMESKGLTNFVKFCQLFKFLCIFALIRIRI